MIQVNLLPDVKLQFIRAKRLQRLIVLIAVIVTAAAITLFVALFLTVNVWQKQRVKDLSVDIDKAAKQLTETPELNRVLTVQNQLRTLPALHDSKPAAKRVFGYLTQVTPVKVSIAKAQLDYTTSTAEVSGSAPDLQSVNQFVDTLKFTKFKTNPEGAELNAFSSVVLTSFGRDTKGANYKINFSFDPVIFQNTERTVQLVVPKIVTTRSETERPQALFEKAGDPLPPAQGGTQ